MIFGSRWSKALCVGCAKLSSLGSVVPPEWILAMIALESAGSWDVNILQARGKIVPANGPDDMRPEISGQFGNRLSHGNGARGLLQVMPVVAHREGKPPLMSLYSVNDPIRQLNDGIDSWYRQAVHGKFGPYKSRSALYCTNLAPARLIDGNYDDETILYSNNPEDKDLPYHTFWKAAYLDNAPAFGINVKTDVEQRLRMKHLAFGLDKAVSACQARYDAELEAAYVANLNQ